MGAADFADALEKIVLGTVRGIMLSPEERERTAFHESGHALLGMLTPGADPVRKVSIIPRGQALGVTFQAPEVDRYGYSAKYLRGRIIGALGGRAAEEVVYADIDHRRGERSGPGEPIARQMVGRWGMSEGDRPGDGAAAAGQESPSASTASRRRPGSSSTARSAGSSTSATTRQWRRWWPTASSSTGWPTRCSQQETLNEDEAYAAAGILRERAPGALARGEVDGVPAAPGLPVATGPVGAGSSARVPAHDDAAAEVGPGAAGP